jgi:hypothetical protein
MIINYLGVPLLRRVATFPIAPTTDVVGPLTTKVHLVPLFLLRKTVRSCFAPCFAPWALQTAHAEKNNKG